MGVIFGQRTEMKKIIERRAPNLSQSHEIADNELHATEITVGHGQHQRSLLVCTISPYLYGERAESLRGQRLKMGCVISIFSERQEGWRPLIQLGHDRRSAIDTSSPERSGHPPGGAELHASW